MKIKISKQNAVEKYSMKIASGCSNVNNSTHTVVVKYSQWETQTNKIRQHFSHLKVDGVYIILKVACVCLHESRNNNAFWIVLSQKKNHNKPELFFISLVFFLACSYCGLLVFPNFRNFSNSCRFHKYSKLCESISAARIWFRYCQC